MGSMLGRFARAAMGLVALLCLSACGGLYLGAADLGETTAVVRPITPGAYKTKSGEPAQITLDADGTYRVTGMADEEMPVRIYGPVGGLYVAQIDGIKEDSQGLYGYAILRVSKDGVDLAEDNATAMGEMLFRRLGIPLPAEGSAVGMLTDNARLNWALLQEFIVTHRDQLVFETIYIADGQ